MNIDTLVLSGGGPSGVAYFGIFKALFEKKIINNNLDGIQEIITTSAGIFPSVCFLIGLRLDICEKIVQKYDILKLIDSDNLSIDDLLINFGLFDTKNIGHFFRSILKNFLQVEDLTLTQLYQKTNIKLTVKVFNATKKQLEYISHETDPDLSIVTLAQMTTAIPLFFKPVEYNNYLYDSIKNIFRKRNFFTSKSYFWIKYVVLNIFKN